MCFFLIFAFVKFIKSKNHERLSSLIVFFVGLLAFVCCESSDNNQNRIPEIDEYGVMLGVIDDYYGTGCQVEVQKQPSTRTGIVDEMYEFTVNKPGKGDLRFIITIEEIRMIILFQ